jgi:hypothetical protein
VFPIPVLPLRSESGFVGLLCSCCAPESTSSLAKLLGIQPQISRWPLKMLMPTSFDTPLPRDASPRPKCQPEFAPCSPLAHRSSKSGSHYARSGTPLLKETPPQWTGSSPLSVEQSLPRDSSSSAPPQSAFASPREPCPAQPVTGRNHSGSLQSMIGLWSPFEPTGAESMHLAHNAASCPSAAQVPASRTPVGPSPSAVSIPLQAPASTGPTEIPGHPP